MKIIGSFKIARLLWIGVVCVLGVPAVHAATVAAGADFAGAIVDGGILYTWGNNTSGQLGRSGGTTPVPFPASVSGTWKAVAMGDNFTLAIDQNDKLWAWGANNSGQLGIGSTTSSSVPVPVALATNVKVRQIVAGGEHALALVDKGTTTGLVYAWGANGSGQLGQGDTFGRSTPVLVKLASGTTPAFTSLGVTSLSSFAIDSTGALWSWGFNGRGELGLGGSITAANIFKARATRVGTSTAWTAVAGGTHHVLALQGTTLFAWGDNTQGQLGTGTSAFITTSPAKITVTKNSTAVLWGSIAAGDVHSYAVTTTGDSYAWGYNATGALALPVSATGTNVYNTPKLVLKAATHTLVEVACGSGFTVGINAATDVFSVGSNNVGQLGNGSTDATVDATPAFSPAKVGGVSLAASQPILSSSTLGVSTGFASSVSVTNTGGSALAGSFTVAIYLSTDSTLDSSDRLLVARTVSGPLAGGGSSAVTFPSSSLSIPEVALGSYYLISQVVAAGDNAYSPSNGAAVAVEVVGPDLSLEQVSMANTTIDTPNPSFKTVALKLANRNYGLLQAGKTLRVETYLSTDDVLDPSGDVLLSTFSQTVAAPGLASTKTLTLNLGDIAVPGGIPGGSYKLIFAVNRDGSIPETGSASNTLATTVVVASADLAVSAPVLPTVTLAAGDTFKTLGANTTIGKVSTYVQNLGAQAYSGKYTINLYLSADDTFGPEDTLLASRTITDGLASHASTLLNWSNVVIPNYPPGTAHLFAQVELPATQPDRNVLNNSSETQVNIEGPALALSDFIFPKTTSVAADSDLGAVTYKLSNSALGAVASGQDVTVEVFLSDDAKLSRKVDVLLDQYTYSGGLASGATKLLPGDGHVLKLPANISNGIYNLLFVATVDGTTTVTAVSTAPAVQMIAVGALDVSITAPALSSSALGTNAALPQAAVTVSNGGGFSIPAGMSVKLYLSKDGIVDAGDSLLATQSLSVALAAGASRTITFVNLTVPDIGQGDYQLVAQLVLPSGLIDIDLSNNTGTTAVTLARPNLAFADIKVDSVLDLDKAIPAFKNVTFGIVNDALGDIPAGTRLKYAVYLSRDAVLSTGNDVLIKTGTITTAGIPGSLTSASTSSPNRVDVGPITLPIPGNIVGGNYYLLFVANPDSAAVLADTQIIQEQRLVILQKDNAPGLAFDYGSVAFKGDVQWHSVADTRASSGQAFEASGLTAGQKAVLTYTVEGPTTIYAPWKILAESTDKLSYYIDGVFKRAIKGYEPTFKLPEPGLQPISVPSGSHTITWIYRQASSNADSYARLDLDVPAYITSGDDSWIGVVDSSAKVGGNYARSPTLLAGQQSSLEVSVQGPALVSFWWKAESTINVDTLSFSIDGQLAGLPTTTDYQSAEPASISGSLAWRKVAFLIGPGPRTLRWTYSQGDANAASFAAIDGLQVLAPIPSANVLNRDNRPVTHASVPARNTDLAITSAVAPQGTYLLDDAQGTSRLPINVHVSSVGADFSSTPSWDSSKLEVRLSTNRIAGDADDIVLGSYARMSVLPSGNEVIFDGEVNLPFDIPTGNYYLIVKVAGATAEPEFTLANNYRILGPGYNIIRAPNLVLGSSSDDSALSSQYPYHPEDAVYIHYTIANTGLGSVLPTDKFKVRLSLMAFPKTATSFDLLNDKLIKTYADQEYSSYLPAAGGATPNGGTVPVTQFVDLPTPLQILVALGLVPAGTPEDDASVYGNLPQLALYNFYFRITLDVDNTVAESSETNTYIYGGLFSILPVDTLETFGSYVGQSAFGDLFVDNPAFVAGSTFKPLFDPDALKSTSTASQQFTGYFWKYALYGDPSEVDRLVGRTAESAGMSGLLFQEGVQNGQVTLNYSPFVGQVFNTISFDLNIRAIDVAIDVQATDDSLAGAWKTVFTLTPPYYGTSGVRSLSGYGGLKDNPVVLSVDGNATDVQQTYAARVTVRDNKSIANHGANPRMRLRLRTTVAVPATPTTLGAFNNGTSIRLTWTGSLPVITVDGVDYNGGNFIVERSQTGATGAYSVIGSTTSAFFDDTAPGSTVTNYYRVRAITSGGSTDYSGTAFIVIP